MQLLMGKWGFFAFFWCFFALNTPLSAIQGQSLKPSPGGDQPWVIADGDHVPMTIDRSDGSSVVLTMEVARHPASLRRGLMDRTTLQGIDGMVFVYPPLGGGTHPAPKGPTFWMKNTPLSLDIIFVGADDRIAFIHPHAKPFDLTPMTSPAPAKIVLEVLGGTTTLRNIREGDLVKETDLLWKRAKNP